MFTSPRTASLVDFFIDSRLDVFNAFNAFSIPPASLMTLPQISENSPKATVGGSAFAKNLCFKKLKRNGDILHISVL